MLRALFTRKNLSVNLLGLFLFCACLAATYWQVERALGGNGLSWAYVFEWPFFAGYAVFMWRRLLHEAAGIPVGRRAAGSRGPRMARFAVPAPSEEELSHEAARLEAYNLYLASLAAAERTRQSSRGRQSSSGGQRPSVG